MAGIWVICRVYETGQILIPKAIRERMGIRDGESHLRLELNGNVLTTRCVDDVLSPSEDQRLQDQIGRESSSEQI